MYDDNTEKFKDNIDIDGDNLDNIDNIDNIDIIQNSEF